MQCRDDEMGRTRGGKEAEPYTLSPSPSSSSDFEFTTSISPHKSSTPADELFYKGHLLPLHLSPRINMICNLTFSSSTTTSSAARDSTDSQSSFTGDLALFPECDDSSTTTTTTTNYFSSKFSFVFCKHNPKTRHPESVSGSSEKRTSNAAKKVIRKYTKKVKRLYKIR